MQVDSYWLIDIYEYLKVLKTLNYVKSEEVDKSADFFFIPGGIVDIPFYQNQGLNYTRKVKDNTIIVVDDIEGWPIPRSFNNIFYKSKGINIEPLLISSNNRILSYTLNKKQKEYWLDLNLIINRHPNNRVISSYQLLELFPTYVSPKDFYAGLNLVLNGKFNAVQILQLLNPISQVEESAFLLRKKSELSSFKELKLLLKYICKTNTFVLNGFFQNLLDNKLKIHEV